MSRPTIPHALRADTRVLVTIPANVHEVMMTLSAGVNDVWVEVARAAIINYVVENLTHRNSHPISKDEVAVLDDLGYRTMPEFWLQESDLQEIFPEPEQSEHEDPTSLVEER